MNYKLFILPFSLLVLSGISFADSANPKSTYDWTGVYVGGFVGGATGSDVSILPSVKFAENEAGIISKFKHNY